MSKSAGMSEFVREAIREKAMRELGNLQHQSGAYAGIEQARDALFSLTGSLANTVIAVSAVSNDPAVSGKLKKLRRLVEEAHGLATDLGDILGVDARKEALADSRSAVLEALRSAGIEPESVLNAPGGDAQ